MAEQEKIVLRLYVSTWAKIIAGTQIAYNGLSTIGCIYGIFNPIHTLTLSVAALILSLFGLLMGIFLFLGIRREKATFLTGWIGATACLAMIYLMGILVGANGGSALEIIYCVIAVPLHGFGIWIIYLFKQEIKQRQK